MYSMFEHAFYTRGEAADANSDDARGVFRFTPLVAPVKATVFPLLQKAELNEVANRVSTSLTAAGLSNLVDTTGTTVGKRYARTDEIGVPFAITVRDKQGQTRLVSPLLPCYEARASPMLLGLMIPAGFENLF
jgi:glycyl-tRNA synthetase